ncbi:MAG: hypothetical protein HC875_17975 [Anaerolineales bacterium]|nr:hypothetical protein [Anaerolineales bacterium]
MKTDDTNSAGLRLYSHTVNFQDIIIVVNDDWLTFAQQNEAPQLTRDVVIGSSLWRFIAGLETQQIYQLLMRQVRQSQERIVFTFRCDSPDVRRYLWMEIVPAPEQAVEFRNYLLRVEPRRHVRLLDVTARRNVDLLHMCSWCSRVWCEESWQPVEDAVKLLGLFGPAELPQITHGICPDCALLFEELA